MDYDINFEIYNQYRYIAVPIFYGKMKTAFNENHRSLCGV